MRSWEFIFLLSLFSRHLDLMTLRVLLPILILAPFLRGDCEQVPMCLQ